MHSPAVYSGTVAEKLIGLIWPCLPAGAFGSAEKLIDKQARRSLSGSTAELVIGRVRDSRTRARSQSGSGAVILLAEGDQDVISDCRVNQGLGLLLRGSLRLGLCFRASQDLGLSPLRQGGQRSSHRSP